MGAIIIDEVATWDQRESSVGGAGSAVLRAVPDSAAVVQVVVRFRVSNLAVKAAVDAKIASGGEPRGASSMRILGADLERHFGTGAGSSAAGSKAEDSSRGAEVPETLFLGAELTRGDAVMNVRRMPLVPSVWEASAFENPDASASDCADSIAESTQPAAIESTAPGSDVGAEAASRNRRSLRGLFSSTGSLMRRGSMASRQRTETGAAGENIPDQTSCPPPAGAVDFVGWDASDEVRVVGGELVLGGGSSSVARLGPGAQITAAVSASAESLDGASGGAPAARGVPSRLSAQVRFPGTGSGAGTSSCVGLGWLPQGASSSPRDNPARIRQQGIGIELFQNGRLRILPEGTEVGVGSTSSTGALEAMSKWHTLSIETGVSLASGAEDSSSDGARSRGAYRKFYLDGQLVHTSATEDASLSGAFSDEALAQPDGSLTAGGSVRLWSRGSDSPARGSDAEAPPSPTAVVSRADVRGVAITFDTLEGEIREPSSGSSRQ